MTAKNKQKAQPRVPKYHRLTKYNRIIIETLYKEGYSLTSIAQRIGAHKSTISREIRRNKGQKGYRYGQAQQKADRRIYEKASQKRKFTQEMWELAKEKLELGWSFEQISGRSRREEVKMVCKETLYKEYYARQKLISEGKSSETLPPLPRRKKKRKTRNLESKRYRESGRGKIPGRKDIDERPKSVEKRARIGHMEGDLISGRRGTGHILTLSERLTRDTLFSRIATKDADIVAKTVISLLKKIPRGIIKTLTFDNGKEFAKFKEIERQTGVKVYFAKPYHAWERGTNENRNGVVRKVLPKRSSFENLTEEKLAKIDYMLNDRPMKCLNWRTPREAFEGILSRILR